MKKAEIDNFKHHYTAKKEVDNVNKDLKNPNSALSKYISLNLVEELPKPPKNSTSFTRRELDFIRSEINTRNKKFKDMSIHVHDLDNFYEYWAKFAQNQLNSDLNSNFFSNHAKQTDGLINWVKLQFKRPRPYALAKVLNVAYELPTDERFQTGSYPSGHSCEAYMFGYLLSMKYPEHAKKILLFTRDLANSRIVAGVHFPSDVIAGKLLAAQIFNNNLYDYNSI